MPESFSLVLCSRNPNVINNTDRNNVSYNVRWGMFLPAKFKKFHCQFVFKSETYNGTLNNNGFVNINLGKVSVYDGYNMTSNLGIIYPVQSNATGTNYSFYCSTNNDNNDFWIDYPTNEQITVTLNTFAGVAMANMPHYTLMLNLTGVNDDDLTTDQNSTSLFLRNI
jgi:hypothetical protein